MQYSQLILLFCIFTSSNYCQNLPPSCDSPVYCQGDLLHTVQLARIFNDSKTFVDLKMRHSQEETLQNFATFKNLNGNTPNQAQVRQFVYENFEDGKELTEYTLPDFQSNVKFLTEIQNITVRNFTYDLIQIWPQLGRHVRPEVSENQQQYSLIPVPNGFIIPGGRFREYYYWDSYWIVDGLLICEMKETARGMIDNFLSLVERYGFVPNGGRVYYLKRSQPPLLTPMAKLYYQYTKDISWLGKNINTLVKELNYWDDQMVNVKIGRKTYTLAHYDAASRGPRPESYREDIQTAAYYPNREQQEQVYIDLKSGAESGWDFSSRWIFDEFGGSVANLSHIQTRRVVPVDLNAFLCGAYRDMALFYAALGNAKQTIIWERRYLNLQKAIDAVLWDNKDGIWYDYDLKLSRHRRLFYPSGIAPLWSNCFEKNRSQELGRRVLKYLQQKKVLDYLGGVPTSDEQTGEQWDFPNAWAPLQDLVVRGLENSHYKPAHDEAVILAKRWINGNIIGYQDTGAMFEKYDAVIPGQYGQGGEYEVQSGFGWSNGVALRFVYDYYRVPNRIFGK